MKRHPRLPEGNLPNAAQHSDDGQDRSNGNGNGEHVNTSSNNNQSSHTARDGNRGNHPAFDQETELYTRAGSQQDDGLFIPGGIYDPERFPALERLRAQWRERYA